MKVIIVGGGIAGLSTYLFLRKNLPADATEHEIYIYERHALSIFGTVSITGTASLIGAGLGIAPNGMRELKNLDPEVHAEVLAKGYPVSRFQMNSAQTWVLGAFPAGDVERWGETMVMIGRQAVWEALRGRVPEGVLREGEVKNVRPREGDGRVAVVFKDGREEEADLVVGADGVRSVVRGEVVGEAEEFKATYEYDTQSAMRGNG